MADPGQAAKDAAIKQRIISHMNADHQISLSYYLRHYKQLSSREARSPILSNISLESMTVTAVDGKTYTIPFDPPLKSFAETRTRVVDMDRECREALDISNIRITEYEAPRKPAHVIVFGLCAMAFTFFATRDKIVPGTWFYDNVLPWFPGGPAWFHWTVNMVFAPTIALHTFETWYMHRTRLRKFGVERGSALWFKWVLSTFIEGFGCFQRFDATVKRKKLELEKSKH